MALHVPPVANETDAIPRLPGSGAGRLPRPAPRPHPAPGSARPERVDPAPSEGWSSTSTRCPAGAAGQRRGRSRPAVGRRAVRRGRRLPRRLHVSRDRLARGPAGGVRRGLRGRARRRTPDRPRHPGPGAGRAVVPPGRRGVERALGLVAPDGGALPARRPRRHRPRDGRRGEHVLAGGRARRSAHLPWLPAWKPVDLLFTSGVSTVRLHVADLLLRELVRRPARRRALLRQGRYVERRVELHDDELGDPRT